MIVFGLVLGGTYALAALGLTIQYGISRIMNLAYGEVVIASSFVAYLLFLQLNLSPLLSLALVIPGGFLVSYFLYSILLQPLVRRSANRGALEVDSILVTFGLMFFLQGFLIFFFGSQFTGYTYMNEPLIIFGASIAIGKAVGFVLAVVMGLGLFAIFKWTRWGTAMRALAVRPEFGPLVAIDVKKYTRIAFALGGAMAAASGVVLSMYRPFSASEGALLTMKALIVVIMGGVGNLFGALLAGLLLGLAETSVSVLLDPGLTLAANYVIFLLVLLWRPQGLFGWRA